MPGCDGRQTSQLFVEYKQTDVRDVEIEEAAATYHIRRVIHGFTDKFNEPDPIIQPEFHKVIVRLAYIR